MDKKDNIDYKTIEKWEEWRRKVDRLCWCRMFCSIDDLPDYIWRDLYEDGISPGEALDLFMGEMYVL